MKYKFDVFKAEVEHGILLPEDLCDYVHDVPYTREHRILVPTQMQLVETVEFEIKSWHEVDGKWYDRLPIPEFTIRRFKC